MPGAQYRIASSTTSCNGSLRPLPAQCKGYRTGTNPIAIAYLLCAKLGRLPRNPWLYTQQISRDLQSTTGIAIEPKVLNILNPQRGLLKRIV